MATKFTNLEIEILMDRPEDCISEVLCEFYTDEMVAKHGNYNKTENIITEIWEGHERQVFPENEIGFAHSEISYDLCKKKTLPDNLSIYQKVVLDDCISGSTMDGKSEDVSPQYAGQVRAAARRCVGKLEKLGVEFSWAERWWN